MTHVSDEGRILSLRDVSPFVKSTRPEIFGPEHQWILQPGGERFPCTAGRFKADRMSGLALRYRSPLLDLTSGEQV